MLSGDDGGHAQGTGTDFECVADEVGSGPRAAEGSGLVGGVDHRHGADRVLKSWL